MLQSEQEQIISQYTFLGLRLMIHAVIKVHGNNVSELPAKFWIDYKILYIDIKVSRLH